MTPEDYQKLQTLFLEIVESDPAARESRLKEVKSDSPELAQRVLDLLKSHEQNETNFLDEPVVKRQDKLAVQTKDLSPSSNPNSGDAKPLDLPKQIGPYKILQKIGEGGHGVVFMAEQTKPIRRKVAIKWVKPGMDSEMILARFEAERQALAIMNHPSIANVYDADATESGQPYFVMELVHGISIDKFCDENELSLKERLQLIQQVCGAVHHAHRKGIIHRDIKPGNVLVTVESGKPLVKVIDFGISKALHMPLTERTMYTEFGQIIGTLEYMSPEQAVMAQSGIDIRSDVYSLGVLLYLLITGETPLSKSELLKKGIWELKNVLQNSRPDTPSLRITTTKQSQRWRDHEQNAKWSRYVKGDLDWITMKALSKEPANRYDTAAEFADDIGNFLKGDVVIARPPTIGYLFQKFVRRNRAAVAIGITTVFATLISVGALVLSHNIAQRNLNLLDKSITEIEEKVIEIKKEKERVDEYAGRMAKMLEQDILENAWQSAIDGDLKSAQKTLQDIPTVERGFAWQFVGKVGKQMQLPLLRDSSEGTIRVISIEPKLGSIALITTDSNLEVWNASANERSTAIALPKDIYPQVKLDSSGEFALAGASNGSVLLIDIEKQEVSNQLDLKLGGIRSITFDSYSECWFVTTGANYICKLARQSLKLSSSPRMKSRISQTTVSPDGKYAVAAGLNGVLFCLDTEKLELLDEVEQLNSSVVSFQWQGQKLNVCCEDGTLVEVSQPLEFSANDVKFKTKRLGAVTEGLVAADVSEAGLVFGAWRNGQVSCFEPGSEMAIPFLQFGTAVRFVEYLDVSDQLVVAHPDGRINLVNRERILSSIALSEVINDLADGTALLDQPISITGHLDGGLRKWNSITGTLIVTANPHTSDIFEIDVDESHGRIASVGADRMIVVSDLDGLRTQQKFKCNWGVRCVTFSPDGALLAGAPDPTNQDRLREGTIDLWDLKAGKAVQRFAGHTNWVTHIRFLNGDQFVSLSVDGSAKLWSRKSGKCLQTIELLFDALPRSIAIVGSNQLATGHDNGNINVWDLTTGLQVVSKRVSSESVTGLCVPAGSNCIIGSTQSSSELLLLDSITLETKARFEAGVGVLLGLSLDPQSKQLQIIGESGMIRVWQF